MAKETQQTVGIIPTAANTPTFSIVGATATAAALSALKTVDVTKNVAKTSKTSQIVTVNPLSTLEVGEEFIINQTAVGNVYQGSNIDPLYTYPVRSGKRLYLQVQEDISATTDAVGAASVTLPFSLSFSAKIPDSILTSAQKAEVVTTEFLRLASYLYPNGMGDTAKLQELIIGKLI